MFTRLRPEDNIKLVGRHDSADTRCLPVVSNRPQRRQPCFLRLQAVRLESAHTQITRYMVVVSTNGRQDTEESVVLGMDFHPVDR